jgi:hypothetical protein
MRRRQLTIRCRCWSSEGNYFSFINKATELQDRIDQVYGTLTSLAPPTMKRILSVALRAYLLFRNPKSAQTHSQAGQHATSCIQ